MRIINSDGSIKYTRFKIKGIWYHFIGSNTIKRETDGELIELSFPRIVEIEADDVDGEVIIVSKTDNNQLLKYYRKNYKTVEIVYKNN
jgi:hypothetical protein